LFEFKKSLIGSKVNIFFFTFVNLSIIKIMYDCLLFFCLLLSQLHLFCFRKSNVKQKLVFLYFT